MPGLLQRFMRFEVIETAVDKCEDVSNVIESVILKNA